jgi:hypothetical protein
MGVFGVVLVVCVCCLPGVRGWDKWVGSFVSSSCSQRSRMEMGRSRECAGHTVRDGLLVTHRADVMEYSK